MKSLIVMAPTDALAVYRSYTDFFKVPVKVLMESEVFQQMQTIADDGYGAMIWIAENFREGDAEATFLEFADDIFRAIEQVAKVYRLTLNELAQRMLFSGAHTLCGELEAAIKEGTIYSSDMASWARAAMEHGRLASEGKSPLCCGNLSVTKRFYLRDTEVPTL